MVDLGPQPANNIPQPEPREAFVGERLLQLEIAKRAKAKENTPEKKIGRITGAVGEAVGELFDSPLGASRESLGPFVAQTPEELAGPMGTVKAFNQMLLQGTTAGVDLVGRALWAPIAGGIAAVEQTAVELGMGQGMAKRLRRDLEGMATIGALLSVSPAATGASATRAMRRPNVDQKIVDEAIVRATENLPEAKQAPAQKIIKEAFENGQKAAEEVFGKVPDEIIQPSILEPFRMQKSQVEDLLREKQLSDDAKLIEALGSPERVKLFKTLDRQQNNTMNPSSADKAAEIFDKEFGELTPKQERLIFGIGETDLQVHELKRIRDAFTDVEMLEGAPNGTIGDVLARGMKETSRKELDLLEKTGSGPIDVQVAHIQITGALKEFATRGLGKDDLDKIIMNRMRNLGFSREDAEEVLASFLPRKSGVANAPSGRATDRPVSVRSQKKLTDERSGITRPSNGNPKSTSFGSADELTESRLAPDISKSVVDAAEELLTVGGVKRDGGRQISDQIAELMTSDRLTAPEYQAILKKHNIGPEHLSELWRGDVAQAGRTLQTLQAAERRINQLYAGTPEGEALLAEAQLSAGVDGVTRGQTAWRRATGVWRGLLVTQLATAARNATTQVGRIGIDTLQRGVDQGIRTLFVNPARKVAGAEPITDPIQPFGAVLNLLNVKRSNKVTKQILSEFPVEHDQLFVRYMSDVQAKGGSGILGGAEKAVNLLNTVNRFQEFTIRRAVFAASLDRNLAARGLNLDDIIRNNQVGKVPKEAIQQAVEESLEMTWAKNFGRDTSGGKAANGFIDFINNVPGAAFAVPFPRFMINSLKFQYEFSPLGMIKLLNKEERAAVAAGNTKVLSRAMVGSAMLYTAWQVRNSEFAGERWYEVKTPDGRTVDLRAFNPFSSYLFAADMVKRFNEGNPPDNITKEALQAFAGVRAGAGLHVVDSIIEGVTGVGSGEKAATLGKGVAGNILAGFLTPLQQIKDAVAEFDEAERTIKETGESPFLGPIQRRIPGAARNLPEVELPTREGPLMREEPLARQLTGISMRQKKNSVESEMDRLALPRRTLSPKLSDPTADRLFRQKLGPIVEQSIVPILDTPVYEDLIDPVKKLFLTQAFKQARKEALKQAMKEDPIAFARVKFGRIPKLQRQAIEALTGVELDELLEQVEENLE